MSLFVLLVSAVALLASVPGRWREPVDTSGVQRLAPVIEASADAAIDGAVQRANWTEYADYGTVRLGRIERPARLFTGRRHWVRQVAVPPGGARYEVFIGAVEGAITVRLGRAGEAAAEVRTPADEWTRLTLDLDRSAGARQSIVVDLQAPPGAVAAWGREIVSPLSVQDTPPDVILISLDTVRRDQLTPYAPALPTAPHLAAFAQDAVRFDQAISTSSWTIASHSALFTGRFPPDSLGYQSRVEPAEYTLPEIFAAAGYRTFGVSGGPYTDPRWGLHQGFDQYVVSADRENAREATSRAIDWMTQVDGAPVFVFLNYFNAHEPLELSPEVRRLTGVTEDVPASLWFDLDSGRVPMTPALRQRLLRAYGAEVSAIDEEIRRLFEHLRQRGRWERTTVIVWADHGQLLGERGHVGHAYSLEEELLRVPLIIKPPEGSGLPPGIHPHLIQDDDLFALAQALAGLPSAQGSDMMTAIRANQPLRKVGFSKIHHDPLPSLTVQRRWRSATQWAVRDDHTKIVQDLEGRSLAYDITGEEERLIGVPRRGSSLAAAMDRFRSWMARMPSVRTIGPLSPAERERLRSLGYIQ